MLSDDTRNKIKNITGGDVVEGSEDNCTAIRNLLCKSFATSTTVKKEFESRSIIKEEQKKLLEGYCNANNLWVNNLPGEDRYLTRGGEARVYLEVDSKNVIKLNDAVYYTTWLEFLNSIMLHNLIFPNTGYQLLGFHKESNVLLAVLKQPFIIAESEVELGDVRKFLSFNDFENYKRNDYIQREWGLILEDMHDENVLISSDALFFIDTVFYTVAPDYFN
jgi:hypothetical protein